MVVDFPSSGVKARNGDRNKYKAVSNPRQMVHTVKAVYI